MKKIIVSLFLIFSFIAGAIVINYNEANAKDKPTVLYIYVPFCSACNQFAPTFDAARAKFSDKFDFVKEDYYHSKRANRLKVTETPSVFIIQKDNVKKIDGQCLNEQGCFEQRLKDY